jgi:hypothetical protein
MQEKVTLFGWAARQRMGGRAPIALFGARCVRTLVWQTGPSGGARSQVGTVVPLTRVWWRGDLHQAGKFFFLIAAAAVAVTLAQVELDRHFAKHQFIAKHA